MKTPILGQTYVARSVNAAAARMVNLFPEIIPEGGKEHAWLQRCPGLRYVTNVSESGPVSDNGPVRGMWVYGGVLYVVVSDGLYKLDPVTYAPTSLGYIPGTNLVSMADNGTQLFIASNGPSYIWNNKTATFKQIVDPDFPGALTVGFIDGYFVFNEPNSQTIWVTSLYDGSSIDPLDFASAEGNPDNVVALIVDHREVWVFGTNTVEVWYNEGGTADFPLTRVQGAFNEFGLAAAFSPAKLDNRLFWLGSDQRGQGVVYAATGYIGQRISTHAVEWAIQSYGDLSDAIGFSYQQDGHSFYVLTFPSANDGLGATWCYDVATNSWHERASWVDDKFGRHRSNCQAAYNNQILVGSCTDARIFALDPTVYSDDDAVQKWLRSWRALEPGKNDLKRTAHHSLQLDCETGTEAGPLIEVSTDLLATQALDFITTEDGRPLLLRQERRSSPGPANPEVMLRWSDDGGHTWSNEHWRSMGRIGEYGFRTYWRRLGMTVKLRDRVYEVSGTDPVKIAIMGAELHGSPTAS